MLAAHNVSFSRGGQTILDRVDLAVGPRSRIGLVGPNGAGKTTLLRILARLQPPDEGVVEAQPPDRTVGYLPQEPDIDGDETLLAYLARRTGVTEANQHLEHLTGQLATDHDAIEPYTDALNRFLALGGDDLEARAAKVCRDVGLPADRLEVPLKDLSGGQLARAALAAILLARFDVFLLDEPTNNLDFAGLDQLESFVNGLPGAMVVVSHDRAFLDRAVDRIVELDDHAHRLTEFAGGWSAYAEARDLARTQQYAAFEKHQRERQGLVERARTQRQWAEQGVAKSKKRPKDPDKAQRGFFQNRTEKQASKVRATERRLDQLERTRVDKPWEGWELRLSLTPTARSGDVVMRLDDAVVERGSFVLGPVDLEVRWQDRLAVLGPNGSGKTTLLRALLDELPLAAGTRWTGPGVVVGRMDQARDDAGDRPVLDGLMEGTGLPLSEARSLLAKFGIGPDHLTRPANRLSPGERTRATLAGLMAQGVNCLVLDEPTNHLDVAAIEQLEHALSGFDGTLVVVSHDRWFLDALDVTHTLEL